MSASCTTCNKTSLDGVTLKHCAKCQTTLYCSRDCQKADWKSHKKICRSNAAARAEASASGGADGSSASASASASANTTSRGNTATEESNDPAPRGLEVVIDKPFHKLDSRTWLHDRPEQDVYTLLIDTYRLRMEDNYNVEGDADVDSIYGGASDACPGFRRFLHLAESRRGLLPSWWGKDKHEACVALGTKRGEWCELNCAVEKRDIIEHYGNSLMPMQLRMFGEQVYGRGPGGQEGTAMRRLQMQVERGEIKTEGLFG